MDGLGAVREAYSSMSQQYIGLFDGPTGRQAHEGDTALIRRHLGGLAGPVLDLGCGPGHWSAYLHSCGAVPRHVRRRDRVPMSPAVERGGPSVSETSERSGMAVDEHLRAFVEDELLAQVELTGEEFWSILARLQDRFAPRIATALTERDRLQARIDAWHAEHGAGSRDDYEQLLTDLGYLAPEPSTVPTIDVDWVDPEIAEVPGPQLVVPFPGLRPAASLPLPASHAATKQICRSVTLAQGGWPRDRLHPAVGWRRRRR